MDDQLLSDNIPTLLADRYADATERVAKSGYRDPVARALRSFVRSDGEGGASFSDPESKAVEVDGATATAKFLITSKAEDRHGDVVEPHGCQNRLDRYAKNPVVFFGHKSYDLPIGSAVGKDGQWVGLDFTDAGVLSPVKFHLKTRESEEVFALVDAGELRSASIGFIPLRAKFTRHKVDQDDESAPRNETTFEPYMKFRFLEWELVEWSVVGVPANPDCVRMRLSKGIGGKPLSVGVARFLEPYAGPTRVWSPGATLDSKPKGERGRKAVAGSVKALEAKVDSLSSLVGEMALNLKSLTMLPSPAVDVAHLAAMKPMLDSTAKLVTTSKAPIPVAPSPPKAAVTDPAIGQVLAAIKAVREGQEATQQQIRKITGKVD